MYKQILRPLLFQLPAETAHNVATSALKLSTAIPFAPKWMEQQYTVTHKALQTDVMGLTFKNPVGLAAGFDKNAEYISEFSRLGFGFIEVGTVTPKPQPGNASPRLFRLPKDKALINRMGFNNYGVKAMVKRLEQLKQTDVIIGGNIGKNKSTLNEDAVNDYLICFKALKDVVDYFVINVSSPNTPNLRELQRDEELQKLLAAVQNENQKLSKPKPILVKISPDVSEPQLINIIENIKETDIEGVVATNTTISRERLQTSSQAVATLGGGGLSGLPLQEQATKIIQILRKELGQHKTIIGVGGIFDAESALEKLNAGANLVQVYTGFIYEGPPLVSSICKQIIHKNS